MLGIVKRVGCVLTAFALSAALCTTIAVASSNVQLCGNRRIAIVLDNSGSMIKGNNKFLSRWAEATYALRTFLYMVGDEDEIGLFTVGISLESAANESDHEKAATISHNLNKDNIDEVLGNVGISHTTATYGLDAAYKWVGNNKSAEQWVVILSDGTFYEGNRKLSFSESVGERAGKDENEGIRTIFIGLEFDPRDQKSQNDSYTDNLFIYSTLSSGRGIEDTILEISSEIYKMKELNLSTDMIQNLDEFSYDSKSGTFTWATQPGLSTYLNQVVVIAQRHGEPVDGQRTALNSQIQMIQSDTSFSWCSAEKLPKVLEKYNALLRGTNFQVGNIDTFQREIQKTFLNKLCYIGTYSGSQLGEKIEFQTPLGDYTYRIYYELSDSIRPRLAITQNDVTYRGDSSGALSIMEGAAEIDYNLYVGKTEIPKELQVIEPELGELHVIGVGVDEKTDQYIFRYNDTGKNTYFASIDFLGVSHDQTIEVRIDLQKYSFRIQEGQKLNIDKPEEGWLYIETQLPPNWLKSHLNGHLQVDAERSGVQFNTSPGQIRLEGSRICVPVSYGDDLDIEKEFMVKAVFTADGAVPLKDEQMVKLIQDKPEIISRQPDPLAQLGIPAKFKLPVSEICVQNGQDMMKSISIQNAEVNGIGNLAKVKLEYDDQTKKIFLYADPIQTWKLLISGETQGNAVLSGTVYRNKVVVNPNMECLVTVAWTGNVVLALILYALLVLLFGALFVGAFLSLSGSLMLLERLNRYHTSWFHNEKYYLTWYEPGGLQCEVTRNTGIKIFPLFPFRIKLLLPDQSGIRELSGRIWVVLRGTKTGYEIETKSWKQLRDKGFEVSSQQLSFGGDPIDLEYQNHVCHLRITRKRRLWVCLVCFVVEWLFVFCVVLLAPRFPLLIIPGVILFALRFL